MKNLSVKQFGSGFAVFNGDEILTPALNEDIAHERKLFTQMDSIGATLIYNPENKTSQELLEFYQQYNPNIRILKVEYLDKIYRFTI